MQPLIPSLNPDGSRDLAAILDYYDVTDESARLQRLESELEFLRTRDILARNLPGAPAEILDVGAVPLYIPTGCPRSDTAPIWSTWSPNILKWQTAWRLSFLRLHCPV